MDHLQALNRHLETIGPFSQEELATIGDHCTFRKLTKHDALLEAGEVCHAFSFLLKGACYQFRKTDTDENIIDLHVDDDCVFNPASLTLQQPSDATIKAFDDSEVLILTLTSVHRLIAISPAFFQLAKLLQWPSFRASFFDAVMTPAEKYRYILSNKPQLIQKFPLKYIASYLNITPETLSRVRATI